MKSLFILLFVVCLTSATFANWTVDSMLVVPKVPNETVTVDGIMDESEWGYVLNSGIGTLWDRDDYFAEFGVLYDDEYLYMFFSVEDDWLDFQASTWNTDAIEIYVDGDNSKEDSFDGLDDFQITCPVGAADVSEWVGTGDYPRDNIDYVLLETELGYDVEMAFPIVDLMITDYFGMDVALNDADDTGAREDQIWWMGGQGSSWNTPSDWNDAILGGPIPVEDGQLVINKVENESITPDAAATEEAWTSAMTNVIGSDATVEDYYAKFGVLYDDEYLYLYFSVIDDWLDFQASTWNTDAIEMYFDGDDSKEDNFDGFNDYQVTCPVGAADVSEWVGTGDYPRDGIVYTLAETDLGYDVEISLPIVDFDITEPFGFDVALNDADDTGAREDQPWWWGGQGSSWNTPSDWNTVILGTGTAVEDNSTNLPTQVSLEQNYPNPFNPTTAIRYNLAKSGHTRLVVYDVLGHKVATLVDSHQPAGSYRIEFDGSELSSGAYFYRLEVGSSILTRKMTCLR